MDNIDLTFNYHHNISDNSNLCSDDFLSSIDMHCLVSDWFVSQDGLENYHNNGVIVVDFPSAHFPSAHFHSLGAMDCNVHSLSGASTKMFCENSENISGYFVNDNIIVVKLHSNNYNYDMTLHKVSSNDNSELFSGKTHDGKTYFLKFNTDNMIINIDEEAEHNILEIQDSSFTPPVMPVIPMVDLESNSLDTNQLSPSHEYNVQFSFSNQYMPVNGIINVDKDGNISVVNQLDCNFYSGNATTLMGCFQSVTFTGNLIKDESGEIIGCKLFCDVLNYGQVVDKFEVTLTLSDEANNIYQGNYDGDNNCTLKLNKK